MLILSANDQRNLAEMNEVMDHVTVALEEFSAFERIRQFVPRFLSAR